MKNIIYRKSTKSDLAQIEAILDLVFGNKRDIDKNYFWVAVDGDKVVGCARVIDLQGCLELASVAVLPEYRQQGIGGELTKRALDDFKGKPVYLFCRQETKSFYQNFGFAVLDGKELPPQFQKEVSDTEKEIEECKMDIKGVAMGKNN